MQTPSAFFRRDDGLGRHRASSDPLSRGGAFGDGNGLLSQEPNPFEQSFGPLASNSSGQKPSDGTLTAGGRRARSTSPSSLMPRFTPGGTQRLPPLALMQSPGGGELAAFGWGDSLRTGPLSPALLNGPAGTLQSYDDSSSLLAKTGLTPFFAGPSGIPPSPPPSSTSATSGPAAAAAAAAHAANGSGGVSFPPPSPATAALFALMTNNTPGASDPTALAGGGSRPHEGPNEANSFEASFARANSDNHGNATAGHPSQLQQPLNHASKLRNSILGQQQPHPSHQAGANGSMPAHPPGIMSRASAPAAAPGTHIQMHPNLHHQQGGPAGGYYLGPQHPQQQQGSYYGQQQPPQQQQQPHHPPPHHPQHPSAAHLSFTAPPPPSNPLDLLTQASFHNDDAVVAAAALSGLATPGGGFPAAAMLAAAQQQQQQQQQQTQGGGQRDASNGKSSTSPAATSIATGRGKRSAASQQGGADSSSGNSSVPTKRARKQTAAAQAAQEEMQYAAQQEEAEVTTTRSKTGAGKRSKRSTANARRETADGWTDGTISADGSVPPEFDVKTEDGYGGFGDDGDGDMDGDGSGTGQSKGGRGRKKDSGETEEEKRKNFLERNRQAALKCRQRKKAWLQSLQTKVELLTTDNDALQNTVNHLREEISSLRAILSAHANCPIAMTNTGVPVQPQPQHGSYPPHSQHAVSQQPAYARAGY